MLVASWLDLDIPDPAWLLLKKLPLDIVKYILNKFVTPVRLVLRSFKIQQTYFTHVMMRDMWGLTVPGSETIVPPNTFFGPGFEIGSYKKL